MLEDVESDVEPEVAGATKLGLDICASCSGIKISAVLSTILGRSFGGRTSCTLGIMISGFFGIAVSIGWAIEDSGTTAFRGCGVGCGLSECAW